MTAIDAAEIPRVTHDRAHQVAVMADDQLLDLLPRLHPDHWAAPTDCEGWTVADVVGHLIGAAKGNRSLRAGLADQLWGLRHAAPFGGNSLDALNDRQVRDHQHLSPEDRVSALAEVLPLARRRTRCNALLRALPVPLSPGTGSFPDGLQRTVSFGQLMDVVYTRDIWMHTIDIERATGVTADRSGEIDRVMIHDAVGEWMRRHGQPVELVLTGPAGGRFVQGAGGSKLSLDAIEFARMLSGRAPGEGLLATPLLF